MGTIGNNSRFGSSLAGRMQSHLEASKHDVCGAKVVVLGTGADTTFFGGLTWETWVVNMVGA